jgi:outer membrane protein OmpA-like peptidoglycan-associated protein
MKKMILLSVFALGALSINAQTEAVLRGGDFWDNWYVGGRMGGTMNMNGTGFFKSARPAFGMAVGKQWTPIFATEIQGLGYVNTTNSPTMFDASDISLLGTMNLMNLIGGYEGIPRMFEIETLTGIGWLHHYMNGEGDTNDLSARVGLNLNFNLGESKAWTFSLRPAMAFNLTGQFPEKKVNFDKDDASFELLAGLTYHFSGGNGEHYFTMVPVTDPLVVAAMNEEVNDLRELVAAKDIELVGLADELQVVQEQLNECLSKASAAAGDTMSVVETVVAFRFNEALVETSQMPSIERVAAFLNENQNVNVTVNGYASPEGTEEYNLKLSQRRADAVKNILVDKYGISPSRISAIGHGVGDIFSEPAWNRVGICIIEEVK